MCGLFLTEGIRKILKNWYKDKVQRILKTNLYISNCYAYKVIKKNGRKRGIRYYIKITDNVSGYIEDEFQIDFKSLNTNNCIRARLYVTEQNELDVCTERMIELGD